jgi:hypothetical protein
MDDGDYLYAFHKIVMPIAIEFAPELVISQRSLSRSHPQMLNRTMQSRQDLMLQKATTSVDAMCPLRGMPI